MHAYRKIYDFFSVCLGTNFPSFAHDRHNSLNLTEFADQQVCYILIEYLIFSVSERRKIMSVESTIAARRAYRSLAPVTITPEIIRDLAQCASLAPSCFNKQPWRYIFVTDMAVLQKIQAALAPGNEWAKQASAIVAVFTQDELDCVIRERRYALFDTGLATAQLILRATELGLVAHPIAGFDVELVASALALPAEFTLIALLIIGQKASKPFPPLSPKQQEQEATRPARLPFEKFVFLNQYQ